MLKRILGSSPYEVYLEGSTLIIPDRKTEIALVFKSDIEYDLPLSCSLRILSSVKADVCEFDVVLPAEGRTKKGLVFTVPKGAKLVGGESVAELEIVDRVLDSKTVYELELSEEMSYKCSESHDLAFIASEEALYTRNGRFFGNRGEILSLEIPLLEKMETELSVISGKISGFTDGQRIMLTQGLNRLLFEMLDDTSFELVNPSGGQIMFLQTMSPKFYI